MNSMRPEALADASLVQLTEDPLKVRPPEHSPTNGPVRGIEPVAVTLTGSMALWPQGPEPLVQGKKPSLVEAPLLVMVMAPACMGPRRIRLVTPWLVRPAPVPRVRLMV